MEKIKLNKQLPYLVGNVVEVLDVEPEEEEDGGNVDLDSQRKGQCVVLKTSTRQTIFLPVIGLVPAAELKPSDLVGVHKDSYLILEKHRHEFCRWQTTFRQVKWLLVQFLPKSLTGAGLGKGSSSGTCRDSLFSLGA